MLELSMILFGAALGLGAGELLVRLLSFCFPSVRLFQTLRLPDWKWPWK